MKITKFILFSLLSFVFITKSFALCNDKNIIGIADNIVVNFVNDEEISAIKENEEEYIIRREYAYVLIFKGASEDLKIEVYDKLEKKTTVAEYSDKYGEYIVGSTIHYEEKNYVISIYSSNPSYCNNQLLRKINYTVPSFNEFSLSEFCKNNPDVKECKMNYDTSKITDDEFNKIIENNKNNDKDNKNIFYTLKKYWFIILIPVLLISIYYGIKIYSFKKKERNI